MDNNELKEFNVIIGISGVASTRIMARTPEEAKQLLLKDTSVIGYNDFWWWIDAEKPTVAVSETEKYCPQVNHIEELKDDDSWLFV